MTKAKPIFTILVVIGVVIGIVPPAWAQGTGRGGGVFDVLNDALRLNRTVRGHVVQHREGTLVLVGDDDRTYTINTVDLDLSTLRGVRDGRPVAVALKSPVPGTMPIAVSLQPGDGPTKVFRRVEGTVDAVSEDQIRFTTRDGRTLTLDPGRIVGEVPPVVPNETATLVYEQEPRIAGVWIETREVQPAAAPRGER